VIMTFGGRRSPNTRFAACSRSSTHQTSLLTLSVVFASSPPFLFSTALGLSRWHSPWRPWWLDDMMVDPRRVAVTRNTEVPAQDLLPQVTCVPFLHSTRQTWWQYHVQVWCMCVHGLWCMKGHFPDTQDIQTRKSCHGTGKQWSRERSVYQSTEC
jgi:hypothetical protein